MDKLQKPSNSERTELVLYTHFNYICQSYWYFVGVIHIELSAVRSARTTQLQRMLRSSGWFLDCDLRLACRRYVVINRARTNGRWSCRGPR
jgi:hypothetical protein